MITGMKIMDLSRWQLESTIIQGLVKRRKGRQIKRLPRQLGLLEARSDPAVYILVTARDLGLNRPRTNCYTATITPDLINYDSIPCGTYPTRCHSVRDVSLLISICLHNTQLFYLDVDKLSHFDYFCLFVWLGLYTELFSLSSFDERLSVWEVWSTFISSVRQEIMVTKRLQLFRWQFWSQCLSPNLLTKKGLYVDQEFHINII